MVEEEGQGETNESPETAEEANPAPAAIRGNELTPENRWAEWHDREDEDTDVTMSEVRTASLHISRAGNTHRPRFLTGASSDVTAKEVNSLIPAPTPAIAIPAMKVFMVWAVDVMMLPMISRRAPVMATHRRPKRSDNEPTKGQVAPRANRLARTNHVHRSRPPSSP